MGAVAIERTVTFAWGNVSKLRSGKKVQARRFRQEDRARSLHARRSDGNRGLGIGASNVCD